MPELGIHQVGQGGAVGFVADVPGLQPCQLGIGGAGAGFGHLGQTKVNAVSQEGGHQQGFVLGHVAGLQVGEVVGKSRPSNDLHQQLGNLDVGQQCRRLVNQGLRLIGDCRI